MRHGRSSLTPVGLAECNLVKEFERHTVKMFRPVLFLHSREVNSEVSTIVEFR